MTSKLSYVVTLAISAGSYLGAAPGEAVQIDPFLEPRHHELLAPVRQQGGRRQHQHALRRTAAQQPRRQSGPGRHRSPRHRMPFNNPISVYRLSEMPIQGCGQSVKAGPRLDAHEQLRAKRQRSARKAMYRNRPIQEKRVQNASDDVAGNICQAPTAKAATWRVFPRPMSSARMPPRPCSCRFHIHLTPSRWWSYSRAASSPGTSNLGPPSRPLRRMGLGPPTGAGEAGG